MFTRLEAQTRTDFVQAAPTKDLATLQRENHLVATAWFDLSSRIQNNNVTLGRRREGPKSWIGKQRALVGPSSAMVRLEKGQVYHHLLTSLLAPMNLTWIIEVLDECFEAIYPCSGILSLAQTAERKFTLYVILDEAFGTPTKCLRSTLIFCPVHLPKPCCNQSLSAISTVRKRDALVLPSPIPSRRL